MLPDSMRPVPHTILASRVGVVRGVAIAATLALLAVAAPAVAMVLSAGLGLAALAILGLCAVALLQALPWALQRLENRLLALRKAEARGHPIEQLQNEVLRRAERLQAFRHTLATVGGQIESIHEMLEARRPLDPIPVPARQQRALARLAHFHAVNLRRLDDAHAALEEFCRTVEQKRAEWAIAVAIEDASAASNPRGATTLLDGLLADDALRSVQDRFNSVFAELEIEMRSVDAPALGLVDDVAPGAPAPRKLPAGESARRAP